jgi:hypothetical protein
MSHGDLIVLAPGRPTRNIFWTNVGGGREPACSIIEMLIPMPIVRSVLTYQGELRTIYMNRDWIQSDVIPLNESATELCGFPFYGPLVINILKFVI